MNSGCAQCGCQLIPLSGSAQKGNIYVVISKVVLLDKLAKV